MCASQNSFNAIYGSEINRCFDDLTPCRLLVVAHSCIVGSFYSSIHFSFSYHLFRLSILAEEVHAHCINSFSYPQAYGILLWDSLIHTNKFTYLGLSRCPWEMQDGNRHSYLVADFFPVTRVLTDDLTASAFVTSLHRLESHSTDSDSPLKGH